MLRTVVETDALRKHAAAIWNDDERHAFIDWIAAHPDSGEVIPGAEGARKVRWTRPGSGKRGGVRIIYFHIASAEIVLLVLAYVKARRSNVKPQDIKV